MFNPEKGSDTSNAQQEQGSTLKQDFRASVRAFHPDTNPGQEEKAHQVMVAVNDLNTQAKEGDYSAVQALHTLSKMSLDEAHQAVSQAKEVSSAGQQETTTQEQQEQWKSANREHHEQAKGKVETPGDQSPPYSQGRVETVNMGNRSIFEGTGIYGPNSSFQMYRSPSMEMMLNRLKQRMRLDRERTRLPIYDMQNKDVRILRLAEQIPCLIRLDKDTVLRVDEASKFGLGRGFIVYKYNSEMIQEAGRQVPRNYNRIMIKDGPLDTTTIGGDTRFSESLDMGAFGGTVSGGLDLGKIRLSFRFAPGGNLVVSREDIKNRSGLENAA